MGYCPKSAREACTLGAWEDGDGVEVETLNADAAHSLLRGVIDRGRRERTTVETMTMTTMMTRALSSSARATAASLKKPAAAAGGNKQTIAQRRSPAVASAAALPLHRAGTAHRAAVFACTAASTSGRWHPSDPFARRRTVGCKLDLSLKETCFQKFNLMKRNLLST